MGSEWPTVPLGELVEMSADKIETKSIPAKCYVSTDSMLPDFGGVSFNRATPSVAKTSSFSKDDILFSNIRTHFRKLWIADRNGGCSNDVIVFRSKENVHPRFMFYSMMDERFIQHTVQTSKGTKMPRGDKSAIIQYNTVLPPLPEQKSIAHILGTLDDKIELNRRMNATLEEMAQALFKSWFADFDPVIDNALAAGNPIPDELAARAEVRKKVLESNNASLSAVASAKAGFPAAFRHTESMGWIPEGWGVRLLPEIAEFQNGFAFYTIGYSESGYKVVDLANISTEGKFVETHRDKFVSPEIYNREKHQKHHLNRGDIVLAMTDITQAMGILGKCGKILESGKYILNQRIGRIRPSSGINVNFLLTYLNSSKQIEFLKQRALGTVQKYVNTTHIKEMPFVIPFPELMSEFSDLVDPILSKVQENDEIKESLSNLRDTLLPKLISGKLSIPEAAQLTKEALT